LVTERNSKTDSFFKLFVQGQDIVRLSHA
jgi:hypothetical protein